MKRFYITPVNGNDSVTFFDSGVDSDKITMVAYGIIVTKDDGTRVHIPWHEIAELLEKNE